MTAQSNITTAPSLQDMAGAMGLALHPSDPAAITAVSDETAGTDDATLLDLDEFMGDETDLNPEAHRSRPALYNSGLAKAGLVGTVGLAVCLSGAGIFKLMTPGAKVATEPVQDEAVPEDPRQAQLAQAQSAASRSQAQLALQTQQQEMARLLDDAAFSEEEEEAVEELSPDAEKEPKALQRDAVTPVTVKPQPPPPSPPPRSPRITPAKFTKSTPAPIAARPVSRPIQPKPLLTQIAPPVAAIRPTFSETRPTATPVDPMAEWQRLATAGRYGSVPSVGQISAPALGGRSPLNTDAKADDNVAATVASTSKASTRLRAKRPVQTALPGQQKQQNQPIQAPRPSPQVASIFPAAPGFGNGSGNVYQSRSARSTVLALASSPAASSAVATPAYQMAKPRQAADYDVDATLAEEWNEFETVSSPPSDTVEQPAASFAIARTATRTLSIGTSAPGHTVTPIIWAPGSIGSDAHFVVLLSEALVDTEGEAVIPAGSQLIVQTQSHDPASGLAELDVVSIVIGGQEFTPPAESIVIRDEQGGLLMGQDFYGNRNGSVSGDIWRIAAGALGQAGALMNQPQRTSRSSVATVGGSSSSETIERDEPNYLGAAMEGGFGVLSDVMDRRQQAAAQKLAEAPKLYHLPADYPLRIFVNRSLSF